MIALDYPVALRLAEKTVLLVGGGGVASKRAMQLVEAGTRLRVVAERPSAEIRAFARSGAIDLREREWTAEDCAGVFVAFAATDSHEVNAEVVREARARGVLANACDRPELCDFFVPAIGRRGTVTIAVSTAGAAPGLARALRDRAMAAIGPEWGALARLLRTLRRDWPSGAGRIAALERVLKSDAAAHFARGDRKGAFAAVRESLAWGEPR